MYMTLPIIYSTEELQKQGMDQLLQEFGQIDKDLTDKYADNILEALQNEEIDGYVSRVIDTKRAKTDLGVNLDECFSIRKNDAFKIKSEYLKELKAGKYSPGNLLILDSSLNPPFTIMNELDCFTQDNKDYYLLGSAYVHLDY